MKNIWLSKPGLELEKSINLYSIDFEQFRTNLIHFSAQNQEFLVLADQKELDFDIFFYSDKIVNEEIFRDNLKTLCLTCPNELKYVFSQIIKLNDSEYGRITDRPSGKPIGMFGYYPSDKW